MQTIIRNPSSRRRRSTLEKCLTLISISVLIAVIKPAEAFYIEGMNRNGSGFMCTSNSSVENHSDICFSAQCIHSASEVLSKIKPEIQPCDDFYQFACGKFIDEVVIQEDKTVESIFEDLSDRVIDQMKGIIMEERPATDPRYLRLPNIFYKACMNTTLIEDLGAAPIKQISDAVGGWPLIKGAAWDSEDKWNWQDTAKKLEKLGFPEGGLFTTNLKDNQTNNTISVLSIVRPTLDLDDGILVKGLSEKIVMDYYDYMVDIAVLFGANREKAKVELREVLEFEIRLANISSTLEDRVLSIRELQESYPYMQWLSYINALLPEQLVVDENEPIFVSSFFDGLGPLLAKTPKRVIANYMIWQIHSYAVPYLSEQFLNRNEQFLNAVLGLQKLQPRWKDCITKSSNGVGIALSSLYVQKYFKEDSKAVILEMVNTSFSAFEDILNDVAWMDDITKQEAIKKLHSMVAHVGYPDELLDNSKLEEYYRKLEIDPDKYFESVLKANSFDNENTFNKLRLPANKNDWEQEAIQIIDNSYVIDYSYIQNSLVLPAHILQNPFINAQRPQYMNYGFIGMIIGHEITHGFDEEGKNYDKDGNLVDWWQSFTQQAYQDKVACVTEQYGNYTDKLTGLNLNGINSQGENIADNGGTKAAYRAYRKWAVANGPEPKLPGLDFTPEQMFWISVAQMQCTKHRQELLNFLITRETYSPPEFRVLGSLRNTKDFSKDFQCPVGSPMNPLHKCEIW